MNNVRRNNLLLLLGGLVLIVIGLLFCIYSTNSFMEKFIGYLIGAGVIVTGASLVVYTFIKEPEHFYRNVYYSIVLSAGVIIIIDPSIVVEFLSLFVGITLSLFALLYFIKFILLKRLPMRNWFQITQLIVTILVFVAGILICVFYYKIDVFLISLIFGIPMIIIGLILVLLMSVRLVVNK